MNAPTNHADLLLAPQQYQHFRQLLRICRDLYVSIKGYGLPLVDELLPLSSEAPVVLQALLALAAQVRARELCASPDAAGSNPYDLALAGLQEETARSTDTNMAEPSRVLASITTSVLLTVLSFAGPGDDWHRHTARVVSLIDCLELSALRKKRPGVFLMMTAAYFDIPAFSVGRMSSSRNAWGKWGFAKATLDPEADREGVPFLPFEVLVGYPRSLVSLIALASIFAEDGYQSTVLGFSSQEEAMRLVDDTDDDKAARLQLLLDGWQLPPIPPSMPILQQQALHTGWRIMQKAAQLYHHRRRGFRSNLLIPLPAPVAKFAHTAIEDVLIGVRWLLMAWTAERVPMANAMAWSLAVVACECGAPGPEGKQADALEIVNALIENFHMRHLTSLKEALQFIWAQKALCNTSSENRFMSLELAANLKGIAVPLF